MHILRSTPTKSLLLTINVKDKFGKRFNEEAELFEFYGDVKEEIPANAQEAMGKLVDIIGYVDADHAGDHITNRSHTRILIFVHLDPILSLQSLGHDQVIHVCLRSCFP